MSNIKKTLKEAREAINNKDYQTTLKLCKVLHLPKLIFV